MQKPRTWHTIVFSDLGILILLSLARFIPLFITNGQSGWHRDELDMLDNARYLDWGYVAYPPVTPFIARLALILFGPSLTGVRFFTTLAVAIAMLLAGLMARQLGGQRWAQVAASLAVAVAPYPIMGGSFFGYSSFDYLWWVLIAYLMIRLLKSDDPRWWLAIGAAIGIGLMTKYTLAYLVAGLVIGILLTPARRYLKSPWLWGGVGLALLIVMPNLIWQYQHDFITLDFLRSIHARDIRIGRADTFLTEQLTYSVNPLTIPMWLAGLYFYFFAVSGRRYRALGWMFIVPLALFILTQGRPYYFAPAYPMLFAGGAVTIEGWLRSLPLRRARLVQGTVLGAFALSGIVFTPLALPIARVNSPLWNFVSEINEELKEEIGWPEMVETVAGIYAALPETEKSQTGILAGNYGEAGAINLYGPANNLPEAISGSNSYWLRGYGDPPPETLIVLGLGSSEATYYFKACKPAGKNTNRYQVKNEESTSHPTIYLCRGLKRTWTEIWEHAREFQ
jgi:hypothetical protein